MLARSAEKVLSNWVAIISLCAVPSLPTAVALITYEAHSAATYASQYVALIIIAVARPVIKQLPELRAKLFLNRISNVSPGKKTLQRRATISVSYAARRTGTQPRARRGQKNPGVVERFTTVTPGLLNTFCSLGYVTPARFNYCLLACASRASSRNEFPGLPFVLIALNEYN